MDWIEQWLGWNPDGGSGLIEAGIVGTIVLLGLVVGLLAYPPARARAATLIASAGRAARRESRTDAR